MKPSQPYNKFYLYLYLALVLAVVSLEVVVGTLVFGSPLGSLLVGILLGLLALLPITNALERASRALDRLAMGQASGIAEIRDFWNPLAGLLRQVRRLGSAGGKSAGVQATLAEQNAAQQERNRLARELHDSIKQQIFSIQMSAAAAQARWEADPPGARAALDDVLQSAQAALAEMNALLQQLAPAPLERVGLAQALRDQCEALAYRTGARVACEVGELPPEDWLPGSAFECLFRVAQEALSNIARHARAGNVRLNLAQDPVRNRLVLTISDDGAGFDPVETTPGGGLSSMQARVEMLEGEFNLLSKPGNGVTLTAALPMRAPEEEEALVPVKADPVLNRAALAGLAGGLLAGILLLYPAYVFSWSQFLTGLPISRGGGIVLAVLALAVFLLAGGLAARWMKPASRTGAAVGGGLAGAVAGLVAFGLAGAGFGVTQGAGDLLRHGLTITSQADTTILLNSSATGQFQWIHAVFLILLLAGAGLGALGGFLASARLQPGGEGIPWAPPAALVCTMTALGAAVALIAGSPAMMVAEYTLVQEMQKHVNSAYTSSPWTPLVVLGMPALFFLAAVISRYGLLRRELESASGAALYHAHWTAFQWGMLNLVTAAGMGATIPLVFQVRFPLAATSLVIGLMVLWVVAALPFFWLAVEARQRLAPALIQPPSAWRYIITGLSFLMPVVVLFSLLAWVNNWLFPVSLLLSLILVPLAFLLRSRSRLPRQVGQYQSLVAQIRAGWLGAAFALILPMLAMVSSGVGISSLTASLVSTLDNMRFNLGSSGMDVPHSSIHSVVQLALALQWVDLAVLLTLAIAAVSTYLLVLAIRIGAAKKRL